MTELQVIQPDVDTDACWQLEHLTMPCGSPAHAVTLLLDGFCHDCDVEVCVLDWWQAG